MTARGNATSVTGIAAPAGFDGGSGGTGCGRGGAFGRPELCTLGDTVHGGTIMAFADTVGAIGTVMNLREGQGTTTIESKTNFFAGARVGTILTAESVPLHRGRRTQVWETRITNPDGRLVAKVTQTQMVL